MTVPYLLPQSQVGTLPLMSELFLALLDYEYSCENFENEDNVENKEDIKDNEGIKELNQKYSVTSNFVQN